MSKLFVIRQSEIDPNDTYREEIYNDPLDVSDEYHSLKELYQHRHALFCALCKIYDSYITPISQKRVRCYKSKLHHDGTMYEDSFIVWIEVLQFKGPPLIIDYHLPLSWWDKFNLMELKTSPVYDGHSSDDVIERLLKL